MTSLPVLIIGVNPFALEIAHIFQQNEVVVYGFLDDDPKNRELKLVKFRYLAQLKIQIIGI